MVSYIQQGTIVVDCSKRGTFLGVTKMFETLDKLMLASLGALSMTREKAEKIFDEYVKRGKEEKTNRPEFIKDIMDSAEKTRAEFKKLVNDEVKDVAKKLNLATHDDLQKLEKKIDQLLKKG